MNDETSKKAGYTHKIFFYKKTSFAGWVPQSFPTTADAVRLHLAALSHKKDVRCVQATRL